MLQKPRGVIHPRVQKVGPEHFGIFSVDKARSKWMLADFYGNVIIQPTMVEHTRAGPRCPRLPGSGGTHRPLSPAGPARFRRRWV